MKEVICPVKNCGLKFEDRKGLSEHLTKKHPDYKQSVTKLFPITLTSEERELWDKVAKEHSMNLSEYVRFLMREGISGAEQLRKAELERQYKRRIDRLENENDKAMKEMGALKEFFIQKMTKGKSKLDKKTIWMLDHSKDFSKDLERMEEQHTGDKLMEEEWDSLTLGQQADVRKLLSKNKIPFAAAIKKVKKKCSKDFETFFKKELTGYGY
jgi:hypothetical protein